MIVHDITMAAREKVYLFKKDLDMMEKLVRSCPTKETGGDLFGLWTNDDEPVLHIITGQGREIQQTLPGSSIRKDGSVTAAKLQELTALLRGEFHLILIGKWHYKPSLDHKESQAKETVGQEYLLNRSNMKDFVVLMIDYDDSKRRPLLSPYFLSEFLTAKKGEIEILHGESVFRGADEVKHLVDELVKKDDLNEENKSDSGNLRPRKEAHGPTDKGNTDTPPTEPDVEMEDVSSSHPTLPRAQADFACNQRGFKVYLFKEDMKMMEDLVLRYQDLETGGDLFGLWNGEGDAVIHIVLGPGKDCKRTDVSFYQDIPYLQRNGELLTHKYMLCHIGEWHSHHRLRLFQPSQGDSTTVIRNYPPGTCGFLLIIANIVSPTEVELSPYLYTANSRYNFDRKGKLILLPHLNAFKTDQVIERSMKEGKETETDRRYASYQGYSTGYSRSIKESLNYNTHPSSSTAAQFEHKSKNRSKQR